MQCFFLIPGLSEKYRTGGLMVICAVAEIFSKMSGVETKYITTEEKHPEAIFIKDFSRPPKNSLFIVTWGPLVEKHIKLIRAHSSKTPIFYYAQSFGWNVRVLPQIPIICVSRYVMAQWALHAPENFVGYVPPPLNPCFTFQQGPRDIDILIHTRKQNEYCLKKLLPALQTTHYKLQIIDSWIPQEEFAALLGRTKIFLYITALHKAGFRRWLPGEGFGLPALEALACGALVGSNLLGGVTDFLTPGKNCIKLQNGSLDFDLAQIKNALQNFRANETEAKKIARDYSVQVVSQKWKSMLDILNLNLIE